MRLGITNEEILRAVGGRPDVLWQELVTKSYQSGTRSVESLFETVPGRLLRWLGKRHVRHRLTLPGFPEENVQFSVNGCIGEQAVRRAFAFYQLMKRLCRANGCILGRESSVLDFGCGWGRVLRCFLNTVAAENLYGQDVAPNLIAICRETYPYCNFVLGKPSPPTEFGDRSFDLVYAHSVFTHLCQQSANVWIDEFARVVRASGVLIFTTEPRRFIERCDHWSRSPARHPRHEFMAKAFPDLNAAYERYDRGEFIYVASGGHGVLDKSFYGQALIPRSYIERNWTTSFRLCEFIDDPNVHAQAVVVMKRK